MLQGVTGRGINTQYCTLSYGRGRVSVIINIFVLFKGGGVLVITNILKEELFLRKIARVVVVIMGYKKHCMVLTPTTAPF